MNCFPDIMAHKLETAKSMGADETVLIDRNVSLEDVSNNIAELLDGEQPDKTIDCSGIESTIKLGMLVSLWYLLTSGLGDRNCLKQLPRPLIGLFIFVHKYFFIVNIFMYFQR